MRMDISRIQVENGRVVKELFREAEPDKDSFVARLRLWGESSLKLLLNILKAVSAPHLCLTHLN